MKRTLIAAALLAALSLTGAAQAQGYEAWERDEYPDVRDDLRGPDDALGALRMELDRLGDDRRVQRRAELELDRADDYISSLEDADRDLAPWQIRRAEELLADVERAAGLAPVRLQRDVVEREVVERDVVVVDDPRARREANRARREAEAEREAALAARLEAEHERSRNAELRRDLAGLQMRDSERGLIVTIGDVLFETGRADIKPGARRSLDQMVRALRDEPEATLTIEGHTDSVGNRTYNLGLSNRRANAVRAYLVARGIAPQRIEARGMGPDYPVASNRDASGRQQNRRVELIVQAD
jgi:outer membrane protein OmpA-like peptidoglycan-associated protein